MKIGQGFPDTADFVDDAFFDCFFSFQHGSYVFDELAGVKHEVFEAGFGDAGVGGDEGGDAVLDFFHVFVGLHDADEHAVAANGVDDHGGAGDDEAVVGGDGHGDSDGVTAAKDEGNGGDGEGGDHFCDSEAGFDVSAYSVEEDEETIDGFIVFQEGEAGEDVFIFGGFGLGGSAVVAFDFADDGEEFDAVTGRVVFQSGLAEFFDFCVLGVASFSFFLRCLGFLLFLSFHNKNTTSGAIYGGSICGIFFFIRSKCSFGIDSKREISKAPGFSPE